MRLYEFTNPSHYLLLEARTANLVTQGKNIKTADTTGANRHLSKIPEIKKPANRL